MDLMTQKYSIIELLMATKNEKLLEEIGELLEKDQQGAILTEWQKAELDRRSAAYRSGDTKTYTLEEVKQRARAAK